MGNEKMKNKLKVSDEIANFLNIFKDIQVLNNCYIEEIKRQDKITQDILHSLEIDNLKTGERSKLATKLRENRKDRRYYKDRLEELEPLYKFYMNDKKSLEKLKQILGEVRKQEDYHKNRTYYPRVLKKKMTTERSII